MSLGYMDKSYHEYAERNSCANRFVYLRFCMKNRHKTQRKAKFYLNNWRSVFYMQGGLKQTLA